MSGSPLNGEKQAMDFALYESTSFRTCLPMDSFQAIRVVAVSLLLLSRSDCRSRFFISLDDGSLVWSIAAFLKSDRVPRLLSEEVRKKAGA